MDIGTLVTEFRIRGFDQSKIDSALRCLVHVQLVQDLTNSEGGGVLVKDVLESYPLDVTLVASELYLEKLTQWGLDVYRLKWGYDSAARSAARMLWDGSSSQWERLANGLDGRCLGLLLPSSYEEGRVVESWKSQSEVTWLGTEVQGLEENVLSTLNSIIGAGCSLGLAYGYSTFGERGIGGRWTALHSSAFGTLKERSVPPPFALMSGARLWRFFSQYVPAQSDIVRLMKECGLNIEEVRAQVNAFSRMGLTTRYRESQYPPFLVVEKKKEMYAQAVGSLLAPIRFWVARKDLLSTQPFSGRSALGESHVRSNLEF